MRWSILPILPVVLVPTVLVAITNLPCFITASTIPVNLGQQAISAVMGESAVVDKETGRIYWEGGSSNTLAESITPKLRSAIGGIPHMKATILSAFLLIAAAGAMSQVLRDMLHSVVRDTPQQRPIIQTTLLSLTHALLLLPLPKSPRWFVALVFTLYLIEAFVCSTHKYLLHIVDDAETYIEQLRAQSPTVEWKVRSFHFENFLFLPLKKILQLPQSDQLSSSMTLSTHSSNELQHNKSSFRALLHRKLVTHSATGYYNYTSCTDQTIAGVWKRAPKITSYHPSNDLLLPKNHTIPTTPTRKSTMPIIKMVITKTLLLRDTKTRQDYFKQQKSFLSNEHHDEYAEFSTSVYINGFESSRLLAIPSASFRHHNLFNHQNWMIHRYTYWFFTCIGLTVPYRRWLSSHCDEVRVRVVKETSTDKTTASSISSFDKTATRKSWFVST